MSSACPVDGPCWCVVCRCCVREFRKEIFQGEIWSTRDGNSTVSQCGKFKGVRRPIARGYATPRDRLLRRPFLCLKISESRICHHFTRLFPLGWCPTVVVGSGKCLRRWPIRRPCTPDRDVNEAEGTPQVCRATLHDNEKRSVDFRVSQKPGTTRGSKPFRTVALFVQTPVSVCSNTRTRADRHPQRGALVRCTKDVSW